MISRLSKEPDHSPTPEVKRERESGETFGPKPLQDFLKPAALPPSTPRHFLPAALDVTTARPFSTPITAELVLAVSHNAFARQGDQPSFWVKGRQNETETWK